MLDFEEAVKLGKGKKNDGARPQFYLCPEEEKQPDGSIISKDAVWVRIFNIGDSKNIIERPKRDEDEKRWPDAWKAYVTNEEMPVKGTPVKSFPFLSPADVENCHRMKVRTVEEIVDLPENQLTKFGGRGMSIQKAAREFLQYREGPKVDDLLDRIAELEKKIGNDTGTGSKRAKGNGVSSTKHTGRKRKPRRKNDTADSKDSSTEAS